MASLFKSFWHRLEVNPLLETKYSADCPQSDQVSVYLNSSNYQLAVMANAFPVLNDLLTIRSGAARHSTVCHSVPWQCKHNVVVANLDQCGSGKHSMAV